MLKASKSRKISKKEKSLTMLEYQHKRMNNSHLVKRKLRIIQITSTLMMAGNVLASIPMKVSLALVQLKEKVVEVYFEKENIWTLDSKGELLITIMSSIAQEESCSISTNVTWGIRQSVKQGKAHVPYEVFLGYEKDENGQMVINEEQAKIVRTVYG